MELSPGGNPMNSSIKASHLKKEFPCAVCDSRQYTVKYEPWVQIEDPIQLYGAASGIQGTQRLVECSDCGLIYENPRYPAEVIMQGYASSNEAGHDSQYPMRVNSFYRALSKLKTKLPAPGAKVLDIGTAGGAFLEAATQFGYEAYGLEPSRFLVEKGVSRGLKMKQGTIETNSFEDGSFDMVCLWDVIEHLSEPKQDLIKIRRLLKPGGILFINYPDIGTLPARLAGKKFWWILSVHLHHFSRKTIDLICQKAGYQVFHQQSYWQTLQFGYLIEMAVVLKVPTAKFFRSFFPNFIKRIPIPYYASQTSAIARIV